MININIVEDNKDDIDIETNGFILLFFKGDKIQSIGHIDPKALTPLIGKMLLDKLGA